MTAVMQEVPPDLLGTEGAAMMRELARPGTLYVFDFDGTLAPMVAVPSQALMRGRTELMIQRLAEARPVAILSGRGLDDLSHRVPSNVSWLVGNHGNEGLPGLPDDVAAELSTRFLTTCRDWIDQLEGEFDIESIWPGSVIEDKGVSLSLHYRHVPHPEIAEPAIREWLDNLKPVPRIIDGHQVFNLLPEGSVTKREAVIALADVSECERVLFIGDDITDEFAFVDAPAHWITVRVGVTSDTAARWRIDDQSLIDAFLERLLAGLGL
ncbi:trehalose-phosphatase [soil metagenome]